MATTKPPHDPVKTVEGMFNGSVTRIAYAMKDPLNYAQSTKAILVETAKKFQDALDDCEFQILDAKWYLEHQLALNKARREAKAREDNAASAKRKREEIKDAQEKAKESERENASKRVKTVESEDPSQLPPNSNTSSQQQSVTAPNAAANAAPTPAEKPAAPNPSDKPNVSVTIDHKPSQPPAPASKPRDKPPEDGKVPESTSMQNSRDDWPKATPQDTPATGNEDFNFVSMFGEPSGDVMDGGGNDMHFDLNLGEGFDADGTTNLNAQDSSLNSLLPGLEPYASQAGDESFNLGGTTNNGTAGDGAGAAAGGTTENNNAQRPTDDFSLPALGPNEFDDFLNANDMNFDETLNLDDGSMMNMENMDVDFDSMFK
ncbi:uncharacterized protein Z518_03135 [Rhinocladiella mackenziei CBS 650.93]|uniref:Uncharacterized protein n=1 Tax=Rhinocladiella mackenziei CBS 650.93 TaxID=1442369 RepID=A0A0D2IR92_9EURO|nr:uncharacterized protein Z518_03135 [Rhinocladiella mackenziei CBS 650.93]KIX08479.1 hypothetical protein Z518_03135 [Rhinocladiella mackenziei CBS 650.93]